jgi:hypothetical protein
MPASAFDESVEAFVVQPDQRRSRLQECARYCRRLAQQTDRPSAMRSLAALAAEFEAQAEIMANPAVAAELICAAE